MVIVKNVETLPKVGFLVAYDANALEFLVNNPSIPSKCDTLIFEYGGEPLLESIYSKRSRFFVSSLHQHTGKLHHGVRKLDSIQPHRDGNAKSSSEEAIIDQVV